MVYVLLIDYMFLATFYSLLLDPPPLCLKVHNWVGGIQDFSVSPSLLGPNLVFELVWTGLGLGVLGIRFWGHGLVIWDCCISGMI